MRIPIQFQGQFCLTCKQIPGRVAVWGIWTQLRGGKVRTGLIGRSFDQEIGLSINRVPKETGIPVALPKVTAESHFVRQLESFDWFLCQLKANRQYERPEPPAPASNFTITLQEQVVL